MKTYLSILIPTFFIFVAGIFLGNASLFNTTLASKKTSMKDETIYSESVLREKLSPIQYKVTQENGTERAFQNEYHDNEEDGIYVDVIDGTPLFSSQDKFDSGTGWPSFTKPISDEYVAEYEDN
jgi:hypothetical protein